MKPIKLFENPEKKTGVEVTLRDAQLLSKTPLEISFDFEYEDFAFLDNHIIDGNYELPWGADKKLQFRELQRKTTDTTRPPKEKIVASLVKQAVDIVIKDMTARIKKV